MDTYMKTNLYEYWLIFTKSLWISEKLQKNQAFILTKLFISKFIIALEY